MVSSTTAIRAATTAEPNIADNLLILVPGEYCWSQVLKSLMKDNGTILESAKKHFEDMESSRFVILRLLHAKNIYSTLVPRIQIESEPSRLIEVAFPTKVNIEMLLSMLRREFGDDGYHEIVNKFENEIRQLNCIRNQLKLRYLDD